MRSWELASAVFFLYSALAALIVRRSAGWIRPMCASAGGLGLTLGSSVLPYRPALHDWLIPPGLLLASYWTSGMLFVRPMPAVERLLGHVDRTLDIRRFAARAPRVVAETLESAYAGVFVLIPIALALHLTLGRQPDAERFWTIVLVTDYVCFGALAWIQSRPPRALEAGDPWSSSWRALNLRLLGAASVQANTFPSGHAGEALAAALLVSDLPWPIFGAVLLAAAAVSAGAVLGRYHYLVDIVAGWLVAVAVWLANP